MRNAGQANLLVYYAVIIILPIKTTKFTNESTSIGVPLLSAAATRVSIFKAEPNPVPDDWGLGMPTRKAINRY